LGVSAVGWLVDLFAILFIVMLAVHLIPVIVDDERGQARCRDGTDACSCDGKHGDDGNRPDQG
jgi:hypothetical protein